MNRFFLALLVVLDFELLPSLQFQSPLDTGAFFAINAFSTAFLTIICVNFMQKLNVSSERELKQLAEEVHTKNIHLEKTNAELDRFLYSTSHDLRSPLSSIKGLVNIARIESTDEKQQRYFAMMIDRIVTIAQSREVPPFNRFLKRRFQSFSVREEIERLDVLRFLFEFRFGKPARLTRQIAKLRDDLRIDLIVAA